MPEKIDPVGGQALIEGVMMRSKSKIAMSARTSSGKIVTKVINHNPMNARFPWSIPVVRGAIGMVDMLIVGFKALNWSADQQLGKEEKIGNKEMIGTTVIALVGTLALFVVLPYYLTTFFSTPNTTLFHVIDGVIRFLLFLAYITVISLMKDVRTLYEYHGAEHKTVHCHEAGLKLTPENVLKFPKEHPRCGTSFIIIVLGISIITFSIAKTNSTLLNILARIILMPVIAGASYELLRLCGKYPKNKLLMAVATPGLWMQKITTREPNKKQAEVAIMALKKAL